MENQYILDTSAFVQFKNFMGHGQDSALWPWLIKQSQNRKVTSVLEVQEELRSGEDWFLEWVEQAPDLLLRIDKHGMQCYQRLVNFVKQPGKHTDPAVDEFLDVADVWIIAHILLFQRIC